MQLLAYVNVRAHLPLATQLLVGICAGLVLLFVARPDLWRALALRRVDPRPAGLLRIAFGLVVLWTWIDLGTLLEVLFTDQGLWPAEMARQRFGAVLERLWDPEQGFEHPADLWAVLTSRFSLLHLRSDPGFVYTLYAATLVSVSAMTVGFRTRTSTLLAWLLTETLYRYSPIYYTGGDMVARAYMFLGVFVAWGEAYSVDSWLRRRRALRTASQWVPLRTIPAWPLHLMALQLAIIYCATGLLKEGDTWKEGTALYYALNLDTFYRYPATKLVTWAHMAGILPALTHMVRWWEILFPVSLVGAALQGYERLRAGTAWSPPGPVRRVAGWLAGAGIWTCVSALAGLTARYYLDPEGERGLDPDRLLWGVSLSVGLAGAGLAVLYPTARRRAPRIHWALLHLVLGKRIWLGIGFLMHIGIDLTLNVGTFPQVMIATYLAWVSWEELRPWLSRMSRPLVVRHGSDPASVRRVAQLRLWDGAGAMAFETNGEPSRADLEVEQAGTTLRGPEAGACLIRSLPALWWLLPLRWVAPSRAGRIALRVTGQV